MAAKRGWRVAIVLALLVVGLMVAAPFILHSLVKSKIDIKLQNEFGDLAHYDQLTLDWSPFGATLTNLRLGDANPSAGNQPTIQIASTKLVLNSVFDQEPHLKRAVAHGFSVAIFVDEKGESSLAKLIREKVPSKRNRPLTIDTLDIDTITITTYIAPKAASAAAVNGSAVPKNTTDANTPAGGADSILKIAALQAHDFVVPIPRQLLGYEHWMATTVDHIEAFDATEKGAKASSPCMSIARISFELDQAETTEVPVRVRHFKTENSKWIAASSASESSPGFKHVLASVQQGFGLKEPKELHDSADKESPPHGTGLLIDEFQSEGTVIEMQGDTPGRAAFWRLSDARFQAGNLAFGEKVTPAAPGFVKLESTTESPSISGHVSLSITELSGHYPTSSFACSYRIDNLDATAFASMARSAQHVDIQSGSLSMAFAGGAKDGQLTIEGSVTLSQDFEIAGSTTKSIAVKLTRGKPIDHVTITGTLEHPQIHLPDELAMLAELMGNILTVQPLGIVDSTIGEVPVIGSVVKETTKEASGVLGKVPLIGELFKKDKKDK